jgi:hypothetical protein
MVVGFPAVCETTLQLFQTVCAMLHSKVESKSHHQNDQQISCPQTVCAEGEQRGNPKRS